jgi:hypothetical protein
MVMNRVYEVRRSLLELAWLVGMVGVEFGVYGS